MNFSEWLREIYRKKDGNKLSLSSVDKYVRAVKTISKEMIEHNVIDKSLLEMNIIELDVAIALIFKNEYFVNKDNTGDKMYSNSLKRYRCYKYHNMNLFEIEIQEENIIVKDNTLSKTEKDSLVKSRIGQGIFRDNLLDKYCKRCIVTNISIPQALIASHIKPWAVCDNFERLDVNNGLLLSATYDKLFDSGLITFNNQGIIQVSQLISDENKKILNLENGKKYDIKYTDQMKKYLKYHNNVIFVL